MLRAVAYREHKDVNEAWAAGVLAVGAAPATAAVGDEVLAMPQHLREPWAERVAIMVTDGGLPREEAERLNRSTRDSYTRCHRHTDIVRFPVLSVCQCCVA